MEKVNTNKKQYNKPILISEEFVPQEYVAVCAITPGVTSYAMNCSAVDQYDVTVKLTGTQGGREGQSYKTNIIHSSDGCKRTSAFRVDIKDNQIIGIYEDKNDSGVWGAEGPCQNIVVTNGPITGDGTYNLTWTTDVGYNMPHSGTLRISTSNAIKNIS